MTTIHVKAKFENVCKRFQMEDTTTYVEFLKKLQEMYSIQNAFYIKYIDEDNDQIVLSNEEEYKEAVHVAKDSKVFKIFITVDYSKPVEEIKVFLGNAYTETEKVVHQFVEKLQDKETHEHIKKSLGEFGIMVQGGALTAYNTTQQAISSLQNKIVPKTEDLTNFEDVVVNVEDEEFIKEDEASVEKEESKPQQKVVPNFEEKKEGQSWMVLEQSEELPKQVEQFSNELSFLEQMGFVDTQKNINLLNDNQGDITKVVQILLSEK
eukprot:gene9464-1670_t